MGGDADVQREGALGKNVFSSDIWSQMVKLYTRAEEAADIKRAAELRMSDI